MNLSNLQGPGIRADTVTNHFILGYMNTIELC